MLLEQFDPDKNAIINPDSFLEEIPGFPETVISIFSWNLFHQLLDKLHGVEIASTHDVDGVWPVYEIMYKGRKYGFYKARISAPLCVGTFEELIQFGARRIILVGNCGVLEHTISDCGIIIPTKAIRDEGISYHYKEASDFIDVNKKYIPEFKELLSRCGYSYVEGTTWTTDAFYRETKKKMENRKKMGAICVEMECSAMQALADFREIEFFQFLYAGDNLAGDSWDPRSLSGSKRLSDKEKIGLLAFELTVKIDEKNRN